MTSVVLDEDVQQNALLDTGAQFNLLPESVVRLQGWTMETAENITVHGFGRNNKSSALGRITLPVVVHGMKMCLSDFIVVDAAHTGGLVILGADFVRTNKLCIDLKYRRITRKYEDGTIWECYLPSDQYRCRHVWSAVPCYAAESITVSPNDTKDVAARWSLPPEWTGDCTSCSVSCEADGEVFVFDEDEEPAYQVMAGLVNGPDVP